MKKTLVTIALILFVAGCATAPRPPKASTTIPTTSLPVSHPAGIYHKVLRGQTLWSIAKKYQVDIQDIIRANNISDPSDIDKGQMIFIPNAADTIDRDATYSTSTKGNGAYIWPIKGAVLSYYNSKRDNVANKGINIAAKQGEIVVASRAGKVVFCDDKVKGLGKAIIVEHDDGYSTLYAYNSENLVACGDYVAQNQPIAKAGNTGRATRPMLHFQVRKGHEPRNPFYYLP